MNITIDTAEYAEAVIQQQMQDAQVFARTLLRAESDLGFDEIVAHSNFNYLFRCRFGSTDFYLKISMDSPKEMMEVLPKERIIGEARAMRFYAECSSGRIDIPTVIGVDKESCCLLMTDVGCERRNLADIVRDDYGLYMSSIGEMARCIGRCHSLSRYSALCRDLQHVEALRAFAYRALIRNGISALVGARADEALRRMQESRDCLIHSDLWAKNMLVGDDGRMALLDFEGAMRGDPTFDLATMLAVATIPAFQAIAEPDLCEAACSRILESYFGAIDDAEWVNGIVARLSQTLAVLLAARVAGPFPYAMPALGKEMLASLAVSLVDRPVSDPVQLLSTIKAYAQRARAH
jgi:tRNA A-37 threonylcarbamoyl transferase component Bud32